MPNQVNLGLGDIFGGNHLGRREGYLGQNQRSHVVSGCANCYRAGQVLVSFFNHDIVIGVAGKHAGDGEMPGGVGGGRVIHYPGQRDSCFGQAHCGLVAAHHESGHVHGGGRREHEIQGGGFVRNQGDRQGQAFITQLAGRDIVCARLHEGEAVVAQGICKRGVDCARDHHTRVRDGVAAGTYVPVKGCHSNYVHE
ncbi:MAG: hypothetical protein BWX83_00392 [Candidatus Cloacimonetes bacterium ADurb.Bin117]|nr:MAG: hypothetical protein BWX83_00392 [Candidatus Cloacimonetes bacterium ADurb.Bin117]